MNPSHRLLYNVLMRGSRGLGGYAAGELVDQAEAGDRPQAPDAFAFWQTWLAARVEELAAGIGIELPALFGRQVQAAAHVLVSRGLAVERIRAGLQSLRQVLERELPEAHRPLALSYFDQGLAVLEHGGWDAEVRHLPDTPDGKLAAAYIVALLEGDRRAACELIVNVAKEGRPVQEIYQQILMPVQSEVGRMWVLDEISVAEEHLISSATKRLLAQLATYATFKPPRGRVFVSAAVAGNQHDLGLQMVADLFEMDGWRVVPLGADMPIVDLAQAVECFAADLVGLSVARSTQFETLRETIAAVRQGPCGKQAKILVGGLAFLLSGDLYVHLGADACAASAPEAVAIGNRLVGVSSP